jgi:hypothetical protein
VRTTTAILLAALSLAGLSACGDSGDGGSGGLAGALGAVSAGSASEQSFAYTDVAALRDETDLPKPGTRLDRDFMRWNIPASLGAPTLTQRMFSLGDGKAVDLFSADRFVTIGVGGDGATRIDGFDGDTGPLTDLQGASSAEDGTVVVAGASAARDEALGEGGERLGDQAGYATVADCLGDVLAAQIGPARSAGFPQEAGDLVAIGVRGGSDPVDVLCVVGDDAQAQRADGALRKGLDPDGVSPATRRRLADEFDKVAFATGGSDGRHWARAEVTPKADGQLGYLYRAVYQLQLPRAWFSA